jgi:hypothetical protein
VLEDSNLREVEVNFELQSLVTSNVEDMGLLIVRLFERQRAFGNLCESLHGQRITRNVSEDYLTSVRGVDEEL